MAAAAAASTQAEAPVRSGDKPFIALSCYLSDFPFSDEHRFLHAINSLAKTLDFRIRIVAEPIAGSFFQDVFLSAIKKTAESELVTRISIALRTLVDGGAAATMKDLNDIADGSAHAALKLNDIIYLKTTDSAGQVTKVSFPLNKKQRDYLKDNPLLMTKPDVLLADFKKLRE
jgi:hypothetical protein